MIFKIMKKNLKTCLNNFWERYWNKEYEDEKNGNKFQTLEDTFKDIDKVANFIDDDDADGLT